MIFQLTFLLTIISVKSENNFPPVPGSTSKCSPEGDSSLCAKPIVLRGQSHIGIPSACFKRADSGPCAQDIVRVFFDRATFTCKPFSYSGCGGNANRFVSIKNCYKLCHPFYRSRFLQLGVDQGKDPGNTLGPGGDLGDDKDDDKDDKPDSESNGSIGSNGTDSKGDSNKDSEESSEDPWNQSMVYFQAPSGEQIELRPHIDDDPLSNVRPIGGPQSRSGLGQMQPTHDELPGSPGWRRSPLPKTDGSSLDALTNIQHESYSPSAHYIKTADGVRETAVSKEKIVYS